jgi:hypothetical protein
LLGYLGSKPALLHSSFTGVVVAPGATLQLGAPQDGVFTGAFFAMDIKAYPSIQVVQAPFECSVR